ncbi:Poly-beta-1,6-N-acetyl-D-glucosamine synthase [Nocardioides dokdonensis FR1436]|uniref:Poly-beta-1,6-N-acetyl-D-glucosamine synthase n=1 Tax=Nocardioides dokdonensis FR1436 TaxID=1300347 RepID=A0A1A9GI75_9ACTN|nr:glycosyltransferase family 2 protein [Nocardioides dokdonensis]ANH37944.1 Poly-beta-1,6-N-acetyl-D-glucosamine synthase [Nocardioides dokdonensis FR1436]
MTVSQEDEIVVSSMLPPHEPRLRGSALARWYGALGRRGQVVVEVLLGSLAPLLVAFCISLVLARTAPQALEVLFWVVFFSLTGTSLLILMECARAYRFPEPPVRTPVPAEDLPRVATVIAAYLPNEQETLLESVRAHLALDYPQDRHLVVVTYNTPERLPLEDDLARLAEVEPRLVVLHVAGSTSKVQNIEGALELVAGVVDVVGIFDADHHPHPTAARRAAQWLGDGAGEKRFDVVQGQCVVRNDSDTFVTRTVAAEFAALYAVAHPGRTVVHDFGIFGGSNGWWRADVLVGLGLDQRMLTEDIDISMRALAQGCRLGTDPRILSSELAPATWGGLWRQRMRWSQGWLEVSARHLRSLLPHRGLSAAQRRGVVFLLGWRVLHPFVALWLVPIVVATAVAVDRSVTWTLPFFLISALFVNGVPVVQAVAANRLAPPGIGRRPRLFARFALVSLLGFAELRMVITRGAVVRHLLGNRAWDVTSREAASGPPASDAPTTQARAGDRLVGAR